MSFYFILLYYLFLSLVKIIFLLIAIAYFTLAERKIMGAVHRRRGPNIEGFWGVLQPIFDGVKLIFKEMIVPTSANKRIFMLAPFIILVISLSSWTLVPFYVFEPLNFASLDSVLSGLTTEIVISQAHLKTPSLLLMSLGSGLLSDQLLDLAITIDIGLSDMLSGSELVKYFYYFESVASSPYGMLLLLAFSSLNVYSIIIAGWASSSKYAFLGALRSASQMVSYEVALSVVVLALVTLTGTFDLATLVWVQSKTLWFVFPLLPIFIIFFITALAETNRAPFDLPEAEAELVAGYNVEYSAIIFAMFFLAEYCNMILMSLFAALAFFGGWVSPFGHVDFFFLDSLVLAFKTVFFCVLFIIVRASFPRYRYDQLMDLGWKILMPIATGFFIFEVGFLWTFQFLPLPFDSLPPVWYENRCLLNPYELDYFENLYLNGFIYYIFTAGTLIAAVLVLILSHPVHSLLALICTFIQLVILLIMNKVEYFGFVFLIVYVGAVSILFLFILMLFDLSVAFQHRYYTSIKKKSFSFLFILALFKLYFTFVTHLEVFCTFYGKSMTLFLGQRIMQSIYFDCNEIFPISLYLYKSYGVSFFFIVILLLSAMVGSITIAMYASIGFFRRYNTYNLLQLFFTTNTFNLNFLSMFSACIVTARSKFKKALFSATHFPLVEENTDPVESRRLSWYLWSNTFTSVSSNSYSLRTLSFLAKKSDRVVSFTSLKSLI